MRGLSIEGYAIVSAAGMIADRNGHMPDGLKCAVDAQLFTEALDDAATEIKKLGMKVGVASQAGTGVRVLFERLLKRQNFELKQV